MFGWLWRWWNRQTAYCDQGGNRHVLRPYHHTGCMRCNRCGWVWNWWGNGYGSDTPEGELPRG